MDKIVCLVGESGSGKTTIAELLEKEGFNIIKSYTTRKPRHEGEYGHIFVKIEDIYKSNDFKRWMKGQKSQKNIIAYTFFDGEHYWATKEQYQNKGTSIYIIDVAGVKELKEKVKDAEIIVIYLKCDEEERIKRMWERAKFDCMEEYLQVRKNTFERIDYDKKAFKIVNCDYAIDVDRPIEEVLKDIKHIIGLNEP